MLKTITQKAVLIILFILQLRGVSYSQTSENMEDKTTKALKSGCRLINFQAFGILNEYKLTKSLGNYIQFQKRRELFSDSINSPASDRYCELLIGYRDGIFVYSQLNAESGLTKPNTEPDTTLLKKFIQKGLVTTLTKDASYDVLSDINGKAVRSHGNRGIILGVSHGYYIYPSMITPLEAITRHNFKFVRTEQHSKYGKLLLFEGLNPGYEGQKSNSESKILFAIAPQFDYRVVKSYLLNAGKLSIGSEVTELVKMSKVWLPKHVELTYYRSSFGKDEPIHINTYDFVNYRGDEKSLDFGLLKLKPNDISYNEKTKVAYRIGRNEEKILMDASSPKPKPLWPAWLYMASVTSLLVLTVGAYVKWKRKQLSKQA